MKNIQKSSLVVDRQKKELSLVVKKDCSDSSNIDFLSQIITLAYQYQATMTYYELNDELIIIFWVGNKDLLDKIESELQIMNI